MVSKVIAALSYKGGVGKSTILASLAYALRKETYLRVVYVDGTADGLGSSMLAPGCRVEYGTYAFLCGVDALQMCTVEADGALVDTLPPGPMPNAPLRGERLRELLKTLRLEYNAVFLDLPGTDEDHSDVIRAAIEAADIYVIVAEPATIQLAYNLRQRLPEKPIIAVLNKYVDGHPGRHEIGVIGTSRWGKHGYVIPFEGPVHNAVVSRTLPATLRGVKFVQVIDQIGAALQRLLLQA